MAGWFTHHSSRIAQFHQVSRLAGCHGCNCITSANPTRSHAHAAHTPDNWIGLPPEMRIIVGRLLTDRFWQAGISEGSKDDFYARVLEKKSTMEGFASTVRGTIRFVRESCYAILYCMSRMDTQFYGFGELPGPLAHSLLADSFNLSAHQLINLLNLVRHLVDNCPVQLREHFLPPILAACCQQMDAKVNSEWMKIEQQQGTKTGGDALTEEMKAESILRQLTYTSVMMMADFLDPARISRLSQSYSNIQRFLLTYIKIGLAIHRSQMRLQKATLRYGNSASCSHPLLSLS